MAKATKITAYKAFNPDMTCRDFKYELGKTYTHDGDVEICRAGFHACTVPFDAWGYYERAGDFARVTLAGKTDARSGDSKVAAAKITIEATLSLSDWIKAQAEAVIGLCKKSKNALAKNTDECAAATGDRGHAAATGYSGHAAATGYSGHAAATGDSGHAAATGYRGHAAATGDWGHAAATGDSGHAAATGDSGHAAATGDRGHAAATGDSGHAAATGQRPRRRHGRQGPPPPRATAATPPPRATAATPPPRADTRLPRRSGMPAQPRPAPADGWYWLIGTMIGNWSRFAQPRSVRKASSRMCRTG